MSATPPVGQVNSFAIHGDFELVLISDLARRRDSFEQPARAPVRQQERLAHGAVRRASKALEMAGL